VCFPWFGARADDPAAPSHGLARTRDWELVSVDELDNGSVRASFDIEVQPFLLTHTVTVGRALVMRLDVYNRGHGPARFEAALHTYLRIGDVRRVSIRGLEGDGYIDKVSGVRAAGNPAPQQLTGETDRIYLDSESSVQVHDPVLDRIVTIDKTGSRSTVLWNPWEQKAARLADFCGDEWTTMVCVETANVAENAVHLEPGGSHTMTATVSTSRMDRS
jgi:glucose-6-phosphate 1-epimerase